jgi:tetratricopeptide (TPR) repeat protein
VADIFISYTRADREWAFWIAKELEALGHTPHVHEWEIKAGEDIYAWMERRHDAADHVLCVVSDGYLNDIQAPYSALERRAAQWQAASKRARFALFVVVDPCRLPTLSDHIHRCELFGIPEEAARTRFREFMAAPVPSAAIGFPGTVSAVANVPIRVPLHFMGRDEALADIETALKRNHGRVAITALHGLRGVGKTTLAAAYADRHRAGYRATWWIRAQTESTIRAGLVALGIRLGWVSTDDKEEPAVGAVMERLRHEGEGILLIFDNAIDVDSLRPYLPRGGLAKVLVTSNSHAWREVAEAVEIRIWRKEIGADYLMARAGRTSERAAAEALSEALGGLPLAHAQAAAFCEWLGVSFADYLKRFEASPVQLLDDPHYAPADYYDGRTVAKTFALAIAEAQKRHPAAEPLILYSALLAPEPIPLFLYFEAREELREPLTTALADNGLDEAIAVLRAFSLVDLETIENERDALIKTTAIRLHRLVREVVAAQLRGEARDQVLSVLTAALLRVYPKDGYRNSDSWPRCDLLTPHLQAVCEAVVECAIGNAEIGELLNRAGCYFNGVAAYSDARPIFERVLAIREKVLGPEHPDTAQSLNDFATLLRLEGNRVGAQPLLERALAIREKVLGPEHPDTAQSLNNLGLFLLEGRDTVRARPFLERALAIRGKVLGPEHLDTVTSLNNVGMLLKREGNFAAARALYERVLAIREKEQGPEHADMAGILVNLGVLLKDEGNLAGARPLLQRALRILEKKHAPDYPNTNLARRILASLLLAEGRPAEALALGEAALKNQERALVQNRQDIIASARVVADALHATGRREEAAALRARYIIKVANR